MTQQIALLRQLWQNQPPQGYRFRATIKADPYSREEGRSMWILLNPTVAQSRNVIASHMWVTQDQSLPYPPAVGATITFNADVHSYRRTDGSSGFGLVNLRNVVIEAEAGAYVAGADYMNTRDEIMADEFALEATELLAQIAAGEALPSVFDLSDVASGRLEQNIVAQAHQRTAKLNQRIEFNARLADLARQLEQVTAQFLQISGQAQAAASGLTLLEAEIADDPMLEEERKALQQLAARQRDLAAAYWRWQPLSPAESDFAPVNLTTASVADAATQVDASGELPSAGEVTAIEEEDDHFSLLDIINAALDEVATSAPPIVAPPSPSRKASKRKPAPQAIAAPPAETPPPDYAAIMQSEPTAVSDAVAVYEVAEPLPIEMQAEDEIEQPLATEPVVVSRSTVTKRAKDLKAWHGQIVEQVWQMVQRLQPHDSRVAPYTLAQIKDGRRRDTDHLKMIGLKAIIELLTLLDKAPTRKELGNYLGYDMREEWSSVKLNQRRLPQADEQVRVEIVKELSQTLRSGS